MEALGFTLREEAVLRSLTEEVVTSSDIEGEVLDREQVRSSLARRLGVDIGVLAAVDRDVDGVVEMTLDATQRYADPLTAERLFGWYSALFPTGRSGLQRIAVGAWRDDHDGPMRVVSGPIGRERVHFEAPAAIRLPAEMDAFLHRFEAPPQIDPLLKAALAHLWLVTIHPFEDGNGRTPEPSPTWRWRAPNRRHSGSTACPLRFGPSAAPITTSWKPLNAATST